MDHQHDIRRRNGQTDKQTDGRSDRPSHRDAITHLKRGRENAERDFFLGFCFDAKVRGRLMGPKLKPVDRRGQNTVMLSLSQYFTETAFTLRALPDCAKSCASPS